MAGEARYGDYRTTSLLAHVGYGPRAGRARLGADVGLGLPSPAIPGQFNPYGNVIGVAAGIELAVRVGPASLLFGARSDAILSHCGHGDFKIPTFRTLVVGVRV